MYHRYDNGLFLWSKQKNCKLFVRLPLFCQGLVLVIEEGLCYNVNSAQ